MSFGSFFSKTKVDDDKRMKEFTDAQDQLVASVEKEELAKKSLENSSQKQESNRISFTEFLELIDTDEKKVNLNCDVFLEAGEEEKYPEGISLDTDGLEICGNGHTIDARQKTSKAASADINILMHCFLRITVLSILSDAGGSAFLQSLPAAGQKPGKHNYCMLAESKVSVYSISCGSLIAVVSAITSIGLSKYFTGISNCELPSVFTGRYFSPSMIM